MAKLVFVDGRNMGNAIPVTPGATLGSSRECTICLSDPGILPKHAVLRRGDTGWTVSRAEPLARIAVNGRESKEQPVRNGDVLSIASVALLFTEEASLATASEEPLRVAARSASLPESPGMASALQLAPFGDRLLGHLASTFQPDRSFFFVSDAGGKLQPWAERGTAGRPPRALLAVAQGGRDCLLAEEGRGPEARSALFAPLVLDGRVAGAVVLEISLARRRFDEEDLGKLAAIAQQAAGAFQGVLALEREVSARRAMVRLAEATRRLSASVTRDGIGRASIAESCAFFEYTKASLMLLDPKGGYLSVIESNCIDRSLWPSVKLRPGEGFAGSVVRDGRPVLVNDARGPRSYDTASFAIAPVISRMEGGSPVTIGVLSVTDKRSEMPFTPEDLEHLAILASQTGTALDNARIFERTTIDPHTRLWTRQYFDCRLQDLVLATGPKTPLSLLLVDIDHLKDKNDVYGREVGDTILAEAAALTQLRLNRSADLVARIGGEEFAAVLPGLDQTETRGEAENVRRAIEEHPFNMEGEAVRATVSVGIATLRPNESAAELLKRTETALAAAKRNGRNRVEVA